MPNKRRRKIKPPWGDGPPPPPQGTGMGGPPQWEPNPDVLTVGEERIGIDLDNPDGTPSWEIKVSFATQINNIVKLDDGNTDRDDDVSRNVWKAVDQLEIACYHATQAIRFFNQ